MVWPAFVVGAGGVRRPVECAVVGALCGGCPCLGDGSIQTPGVTGRQASVEQAIRGRFLSLRDE